MKYLNISFLLIFLLFTGCSLKEKPAVEIDVTKVKTKKDQRKRTLPLDKAEQKQDTAQKQMEEKGTEFEDKETSKEVIESKGFNIAVIYPSQVVGKYAIDGVNTIISYLLFKDIDFDLKTYDCISEDEDKIKDINKKLDLNKYNQIVLFMTKDGVQKFLNTHDDETLNIYVPLVNKQEINFDSSNVVFGGIDYAKQFEKLFKVVYDKNSLSEFHDSTSLGQILSYKQDSMFPVKYKFQKRLVRNKINYESFLRNNKLIKDTTIFLNTPIVQTSILLSQMRAYDVEYNMLLSTQINYTPLILSLTQTDDRKNMIIANSIGKIDDTLIEYGATLNTNFKYNWVNYSTLIGTDYLLSKRYKGERYFENEIIDNQVQFGVNLFQTGKYSLKPYIIDREEFPITNQ